MCFIILEAKQERIKKEKERKEAIAKKLMPFRYDVQDFAAISNMFLFAFPYS